MADLVGAMRKKLRTNGDSGTTDQRAESGLTSATAHVLEHLMDEEATAQAQILRDAAALFRADPGSWSRTFSREASTA